MKTEPTIYSLRVPALELRRWRAAARDQQRSVASLVRYAVNQLLRRTGAPDWETEENDDS